MKKHPLKLVAVVAVVAVVAEAQVQIMALEKLPPKKAVFFLKKKLFFAKVVKTLWITILVGLVISEKYFENFFSFSFN